MIRGVARALCFGLILSAGSAWAQLGNLEQKCVNTINKDTIKVQAAQGKLDTGCVKNFVKTGASADACVTADAKGKVAGKKDKTSADDMKKCSGNIPSFAYTGATTANAAAVQAEMNLLHDQFGTPADSGLFSCDTQPAKCLCQRQVVDRVEKLFNAMSAEFVRCKNAALAIGKLPTLNMGKGASSPSDIGKCITDGTIGLSVQADPKSAVSKAETQLTDTQTKFCMGGEFDAGACTGLTGATLIDCLANHIKCRFCEMANAADNLPVDCSTWSGITCP
jgi:hypothetical protein